MQPDEMLSEPLRDIGVRATPTVLLINSKGIVEDAWIGLLGAAREEQLLAKLNLACTECKGIDSPAPDGSHAVTKERSISR
jgi:hypothetical protein